MFNDEEETKFAQRSVTLNLEMESIIQLRYCIKIQLDKVSDRTMGSVFQPEKTFLRASYMISYDSNTKKKSIYNSKTLFGD